VNVADSLSGLGDLGRVEDGVVCVKFSPASKYELRFYPPDPETAARIRARENDDHVIPVRLDLVNRDSGKSVRGFKSYINPWWLRQFVFAVAKAVAYTEREWETMPQEFIDKMEAM
jgi:hypothetical protein